MVEALTTIHMWLSSEEKECSCLRDQVAHSSTEFVGRDEELKRYLGEIKRLKGELGESRLERWRLEGEIELRDRLIARFSNSLQRNREEIKSQMGELELLWAELALAHAKVVDGSS